MPSYIAITKNEAGTLSRISAKCHAQAAGETAAASLARLIEHTYPGLAVEMVFCIHGEYPLPELNRMALPPRGALTQCFIFDETEVSICRTNTTSPSAR